METVPYWDLHWWKWGKTRGKISLEFRSRTVSLASCFNVLISRRFPCRILYFGPEIPCFLNFLDSIHGRQTRIQQDLYIFGITRSRRARAKRVVVLKSSIERQNKSKVYIYLFECPSLVWCVEVVVVSVGRSVTCVFWWAQTLLFIYVTKI